MKHIRFKKSLEHEVVHCVGVAMVILRRYVRWAEHNAVSVLCAIAATLPVEENLT